MTMGKRQTVDGYTKDQQSFYLRHAAFLMEISERTLRRWIRKGKLHKAWQHELNRWWYFPLSEVNAVRSADGKRELTREEAIERLETKYPDGV